MSTTEHPDRPDRERRRLLTVMSVGLSALGAALLGVPFAGFLLAPFFERSTPRWRRVGTVDSFTVGTTVQVTLKDASARPWAGKTAQTAAWLRRAGEAEFTAFSVNCTHLGCPVRWVQSADLFLCPCHGGVYYADGRVAAGPPPHALIRYPVRVNGQWVEVQTSPIPIT